MENIMACRICLATDVKLYEMCKYSLRSAYENLTGLDMTQSETCLRHICSYCGTLLNKFATFREKCVRSQLVLEHLIGEHGMITAYHIKGIDRNVHNLTVPNTTQFIENFNTTVVVKEEIYDQNIKGSIAYYTPTAGKRASQETIINVYEQNIKPDLNDADITEEYDDYNYENDNYFTSNDIVTSKLETSNDTFKPDDSDEEPLSTKVRKKKRKKSKTSKKEPNIKIDVKSENASDQNISVLIVDSNRKDTKNQLVDTEEEIEHKLVILTEEEQIQEVLSRKSSSNYQNSVYKCDSCFKGFMTEATYKNHMVRHDQRCGPAVCAACGTRWADARALRAHTLISHERKYICKLCGSTSKSLHKAREHAAWHRGATYACTACGAAFRRSTSYLTHVRLRHGTHACADCGASFIGRHGLNMHRKKAHSVQGERSLPQLECDSCHCQFDNKDALARHAALGCDAELSPCLHCGEHFPPPLLKEHLDSHQKASAARTCHLCSLSFSHERSFAAHHARVHCGARARRATCSHVCEVCGYKCTTRAALVTHQRTHTGEKPFPCGACGKRFSVYQRLQIHLRTHSGERPFPCSHCPKAFKHKAALNRHDRVHTGAKPYTCPQCGKSFSQSNSMKQHCAGVHMKMYIYSRRSANKQN